MTQQAEFDRVRSYLVSQAEKKTFDQLRQVVEEARASLFAEVEGLTEEQARFKPALSSVEGPALSSVEGPALSAVEGPAGQGEDAWSIAEVLRHCIHEQEGVALRVRALGFGDPARGPSLGRVVGRGDASISDLIRDLKAANFALDHAVGSVEGIEKLKSTAPHPFFGELNCRAWFLFQRVHDLDHTRQVQKIKADPAFPGRRNR